MFDLGYAMGINVLLQCAYLWYLNNIYDNDAYFAHLFSFLMIISFTLNTQGKESLKLAQPDEKVILKFSSESEIIHAHILI